jgi:AcrR family transcriptional regulator
MSQFELAIRSDQMAPASPISRSRRRVRTPDGEARGAILAATERLLVQRPLHELSVRDIADEAGASRGSFYAYFTTKSAVLATLAESVCAELFDIWQPWFDGAGPVDADELRANFDGSVRLWSAHRSILTATVESFRVDPEVTEMWGSLMKRLVDSTRARIERARAAGNVAGLGDAATLAESLIWSTERLHYVGLSESASALHDQARLVDVLVLLWSRMLAG